MIRTLTSQYSIVLRMEAVVREALAQESCSALLPPSKTNPPNGGSGQWASSNGSHADGSM